mmetsp:Transcript_4335/g.7402  ORF Transcript_4335/g.7402 Transcript_4335/m.7402 type:complete len:194 (+) Transcript_4335:95-676(+)
MNSFPVVLGSHLSDFSAQFYDSGLQFTQDNNPRSRSPGQPRASSVKCDFCVTSSSFTKFKVFWVREEEMLESKEQCLERLKARVGGLFENKAASVGSKRPMSSEKLDPEKTIFFVTRTKSVLRNFLAVQKYVHELGCKCVAVLQTIVSVTHALQYLQQKSRVSRPKKLTPNIEADIVKVSTQETFWMFSSIFN